MVAAKEAAISSGARPLFRATCAAARATSGVSVKPGQTTFAVTPGQRPFRPWIRSTSNAPPRIELRPFSGSSILDIAQPNVCSVGGYTEAVKVAAMAQTFNLPIANGGGWPHHNAHLQAAMANGWRVEFHFEMWGVGVNQSLDAAAMDLYLGFRAYAADIRLENGTGAAAVDDLRTLVTGAVVRF